MSFIGPNKRGHWIYSDESTNQIICGPTDVKTYFVDDHRPDRFWFVTLYKDDFVITFIVESRPERRESDLLSQLRRVEQIGFNVEQWKFCSNGYFPFAVK